MTPIARLLSLRVDLRDPEAAAEVTPEALAAYAERTGWTLATTTGAHRVYRHGAGELHVPITSGWPNYGRAILSEINMLAEHEGRSPLAIWAELVGLPAPEAPPPCHDVALGEAIAAPGAPEAVPAPAGAATGQGTLPGVERRRANTGSRLGAQDMYSADGGASWWYKRPACVMK